MTLQTKATVDQVTLEVIRNALPAIANEMSFDLQRTSYNMMIYEVRDYSVALIDTRGRLMSQNLGGVSHFVADMGAEIKDGIERYGLDGFVPGDVILTNYQKPAGQHLNHGYVYVPVFWEGELICFAAIRAHWVDAGGTTTGFGGNVAFDAWSEGQQWDQLKIYEAGVPDRKLLKLIRDNLRYPEASMGDLRSEIAACRLGERRVHELLGRYGKDVIIGAIERIYEETEQKCRAVVATLPDGTYTAESFIDPARPGAQRTFVRVTVIISGSDMTIDFSECGPDSMTGPNCRSYAGAYIAYKALTAPTEPLNEGSFGALKAIIPEGTFMMARFPQVPILGWSTALPTVVDTVWKALAPAIPDRVAAGHHGALGIGFVFFGYDPRRQRRFVMQSIESGGWGGRPFEDGESIAMSMCQGDVRNAPIENIELKTPMLILERAVRQDSGGPGKFRGGAGIQVRAKNLVEGRWSLGPGNRNDCLPWGLWGGKDGTRNDCFLKTPQDSELKILTVPGQHLVPANTECLAYASGGGGWGDPLERDPAMVLTDVIEGYVSVRSAHEDYGVVLTANGRGVDEAKTRELRASLRKKAPSQREARATGPGSKA